MANIAVRNQPESRIPAPKQSTSSEWEPFRMMQRMLSWDPFREMAPMLREEPGTFMPAFEIKETKEGYVFKADVPGVKESDIDISITGNRLNVSGKRESEREDKTDTFYTYERSYGAFSRSFTLPEGAETRGIQADLKDGVLTLSVAKKPEAQPQKIAIKPKS